MLYKTMFVFREVIMKQKTYPFAALLGQDQLVLAILLNIVNPELGGLLIKGVKGSGKSTFVRSISDIIPPIEVMNYCEFNCNPDCHEEWCNDCLEQYTECVKNCKEKPVEIITIPLSVTEERLMGSVDVEHLLKEGEYHFIPGLLAKVNRQILYIDEVNLLPDHIVDDILDVAACGWNRVERDNFSIEHPSRFLMFGTMNPEEGELRPQILDRFPLSVTVDSVQDQDLRMEIIKRNIAFEQHPAEFIWSFEDKTTEIKDLIIAARKNLANVYTPDYLIKIVAKFCADQKVDGHRADITIIKTAQTHAAMEQKKIVQIDHIIQAAKLVLIHRTRDGGLLKPLTQKEISYNFEQIDIETLKTNTETSTYRKNDFNLTMGGLLKPEKK